LAGARRTLGGMGGHLWAPHFQMTAWEILIQQSINGLTRGAVFALIALGYTMVYGIIELINFAHGDVFMLGLFISLSWFTLLGVTKTLTSWQLVTILPLVFILTMASTAALNVAIDRVAYRPLRGSTRLAPLITAWGMTPPVSIMVPEPTTAVTAPWPALVVPLPATQL